MILIKIEPETNQAVDSIYCEDIEWAEETLGGRWIEYKPEEHRKLGDNSNTVYWSDELQDFSRARPDPWSVYQKEQHDWVMPAALIDREASKILIAFNVYDKVDPNFDGGDIKLELYGPCNHCVFRWGDSKEDHTFLFVSRNVFAVVDYTEERDVAFRSVATRYKDHIVPSQVPLRLTFSGSSVRLYKWNDLFLREELIAELPAPSFTTDEWYDAWSVDCIGGQR